MTFESEFGGFEEEGKCYAITTPETPRPWENYLYSGDGKYQVAITQRGEGISFYDSELVNLVSTGRNFVILDGDNCWSVNAGKAPHKADTYRCEHRLGTTTFFGSKAGIDSKLEVGLALNEYLELNRLTLKNTTVKSKTISLIGYHLVKLGGVDNRLECQGTRFSKEIGAICCQRRHFRTPKYKYSAFFVADTKPETFCGSYLEFLGGDFGLHEARPLKTGKLPNIEAHGTEPILALQHSITIEAGQTVLINYAFGLSDSIEESTELANKMVSRFESVPQMFASIKSYFDNLVKQNNVTTPDTVINMSANIWCKSQLFRQTISARSTPWFNWRNHIQDSWAFMIFDPKWMPFWIEQTCRAAREDGFLPRCSARVPGLPFPDQRHPDIATWTAFCAARYFAETGDRSLFSKTIEVAGGTKKTTILDAIVSGLQWLLDHRGSHGMVLFLDGDWSDPLEEAGKLGIGESPWTTMALINALNNFVPVLRKIGSVDLADTFGAEITKLTGAVNSSAWDGNWYIRGIDDSGKPFSTASDPDGNVSLLMQAWAVLSGVSSPERTKLLVAAVDKNNKTSIGPILYGPPFLKQRPWIGRETAKMPGTCVNGSVYLHVSMMWAMVEFILGRPDQGLEVLHQSLALSEGGDLNKRKAIPLWMPNYWHGPHSQTPGQVGETMTSAGPPWFIVIMFEYVFGLKAEFDGLRIQPCFPSTWQTGSCQRPYRGSMLNFEFNRDSSIKGIVVTMDGKALEKQLIPSDLKMGSYNIKVIIGN